VLTRHCSSWLIAAQETASDGQTAASASWHAAESTSQTLKLALLNVTARRLSKAHKQGA